jgi:hypothetical protein
MTLKTIVGLKLQGAIFLCLVAAAVCFNFNREALAILPLIGAGLFTWAAHAVTKWDDENADSIIE